MKFKSLSSLAISYRPQRFCEVFGQDYAIRQLKEIIRERNARLPILISGGSGVGKSTLAKIFAMAYVCKNLDLNSCEPCLHCESCQRIAAAKLWENSLSEIYYTNAAEWNLVKHDTRALRSFTTTMSMESDRKVAIVEQADHAPIESLTSLYKFIGSLGITDEVAFVFVASSLDEIPEEIFKKSVQVKLNNLEPLAIAIHLKKILEIEGGRNIDEAVLKEISLHSRKNLWRPLNFVGWLLPSWDSLSSKEIVKRLETYSSIIPERPLPKYTREQAVHTYLFDGLYAGNTDAILEVINFLKGHCQPTYAKMFINRVVGMTRDILSWRYGAERDIKRSRLELFEEKFPETSTPDLVAWWHKADRLILQRLSELSLQECKFRSYKDPGAFSGMILAISVLIIDELSGRLKSVPPDVSRYESIPFDADSI